MSKHTRRGRRAKRKERIGNLLVDLRTGQVSCAEVEADVLTQRRYLELHYTLLPEDVESWSVEQLERKVEIARLTGARRDWERALMVLAHHRSEPACDLLRELEPHVPEELRGFHQLALGESLGWLGYDYVVDEEGRARVLPADAPWPEGAAN